MRPRKASPVAGWRARPCTVAHHRQGNLGDCPFKYEGSGRGHGDSIWLRYFSVRVTDSRAIMIATRSLSVGVSVGGCLLGRLVVGLRFWVSGCGSGCLPEHGQHCFLLAQKDIVLGFRVLAGSRPMVPGQCEHGAVVTPAGFRELGRGISVRRGRICDPPEADLRL